MFIIFLVMSVILPITGLECDARDYSINSPTGEPVFTITRNRTCICERFQGSFAGDFVNLNESTVISTLVAKVETLTMLLSTALTRISALESCATGCVGGGATQAASISTGPGTSGPASTTRGAASTGSASTTQSSGSAMPPAVPPELANAFYGGSVATSNDGRVIVVGAYLNASAFVHTQAGSVWQTQKLVSSPFVPSRQFGWVVALSSDASVLAVTEHNSYSGGVYIFSRNETSRPYVQEAYLSKGSLFGVSMSLSANGSNIFIGASSMSAHCSFYH
eukprot:TRINITY_DN3382_c0_g1_i1.p1 TRINITY_DN3382_c0_g1~~TRINITY_DN3382_c0_g1_i1.p1  ORF type:complete len:279 (+),score=10.20 TRINITY_DN3382_c0_g1_i1:182-1018(+)